MLIVTHAETVVMTPHDDVTKISIDPCAYKSELCRGASRART